MGFSRQEYWSGLPFSPPVDHNLSELYSMTCLSPVALHSMTHIFIELRRPLHHDKAVIYEGAYLCVCLIFSRRLDLSAVGLTASFTVSGKLLTKGQAQASGNAFRLFLETFRQLSDLKEWRKSAGSSVSLLSETSSSCSFRKPIQFVARRK